MFIMLILILWGVYALILHKKLREKFMFSKELLPLISVSLISIISLGVSYMASGVSSFKPYHSRSGQ